jgi:hypothetical protein
MVRWFMGKVRLAKWVMATPLVEAIRMVRGRKVTNASSVTEDRYINYSCKKFR